MPYEGETTSVSKFIFERYVWQRREIINIISDEKSGFRIADGEQRRHQKESAEEHHT